MCPSTSPAPPPGSRCILEAAESARSLLARAAGGLAGRAPDLQAELGSVRGSTRGCRRSVPRRAGRPRRMAPSPSPSVSPDGSRAYPVHLGIHGHPQGSGDHPRDGRRLSGLGAPPLRSPARRPHLRATLRCTSIFRRSTSTARSPAGASYTFPPPNILLPPAALAEFIREAELTQWFSVPSTFAYMMRGDAIADGDFPSPGAHCLVRRGAPAGGALPHWMARVPQPSYTNLYGPTETTIASSFHTDRLCADGHEHAHPNRPTPCTGEDILVLDEQLPAVPAARWASCTSRAPA